MGELFEKRHLKIPSVLDRVPEACAFVISAAEAVGLNDRAVYHCQMATDEWCTNIVQHGFGDNGKRGWIDITCEAHPNEFWIHISDDGPSFDPRTLAEVDPNLPLEDRQPGGLGWFFIRKIMDEVRYEYKDGRNHLTLIKRNAQSVTKSEAMDEKQFPVHEHTAGIWVMTLKGRIDSTVSRQLESALDEAINAARIKLVIDMSDVQYISSSGLKALITAHRKTQPLHGNIALAGLTARVQEIFDISGFDTIFRITTTPGEAAEYLITQTTAK